MTSVVIDCIQPPSVAAMRAAGVTGLSRYLSKLTNDSLGKIIHKAEYDALIAAGFEVVLNWEYSARDWLGGATAGTSHATQAVSQAKALGYPKGCAIIGSADFNMTLAEWNSSCKAYALAFAAGIRAGGYLPGVYGPWDVLGWCKDLGCFAVYWQAGMSTAWSGGRNKNLWPGAHLRQRRQATIGGADVDINDIVQPGYGQAPLPVEVPDMDPNAHDIIPDLTNKQVLADIWHATVGQVVEGAGQPDDGGRFKTPFRFKQVRDQLAQPVSVQVDAAAVADALASNAAFLKSMAKAVNDDAAQRLAS